MRIIRAVPFALAALAFIACGSSSTKKTPDAHGSSIDAPGGGGIDAPAGTPDAASAGVTGFGMPCAASGTPACPTEAATCDFVTQGATTGWCSPGCGQSAWNADPTKITAPTGGDAMCKTAYKGTSPAQGTPACVIFTQDMTDKTKADFTCALLCGTYTSGGQTVDFGGCPGGLTCVTADNLCE